MSVVLLSASSSSSSSLSSFSSSILFFMLLLLCLQDGVSFSIRLHQHHHQHHHQHQHQHRRSFKRTRTSKFTMTVLSSGPSSSSSTSSSSSLPSSFHVAPMQCYTNRHLRYLYRLLSRSTILWTEMEKTSDLKDGLLACKRRLDHDPLEHPLTLQLGGNRMEEFEVAFENVMKGEYCFDEINLNCGCPTVETGGADFGAILMRDPVATTKLVSEMSHFARRPISIKCRIGAHMHLNSDGTAPLDDYETLHSFVDKTSSTGCASHYIVHARAAILCGLSASKNRSVPPLRHDFVYRLASDFPRLRFTLNGGIDSIASLRRHRMAAEAAGVDGLMAGRWLLTRPLDLWAIEREMRGFGERGVREVDEGGGDDASASSSLTSFAGSVSRVEAVRLYCAYAKSMAGEKFYPLPDIVLPLLLVATQLEEDYGVLFSGGFGWNGDDVAANQHGKDVHGSRAEEGEDDESNGNERRRRHHQHGMMDNDKGEGVDLDHGTRLSEEEIRAMFVQIWETAACLAGEKGSKRGLREAEMFQQEPLSFRKLNKLLSLSIGKKVSTNLIRKVRV